MTEEERAKQAAKEARAAEREAREAAELEHNKPKATGMSLFGPGSSTQPSAAPAAPGITLPSLPGAAAGTAGTSSTSLFGPQSQQNNQAKPTLSLFGAATQNPTQSTTQPTSTGFSILGAANNTQNQQQSQRPTLASMPTLGSTAQSANPPSAPTQPAPNPFSAFQFPKPVGTTPAPQQPGNSLFGGQASTTQQTNSVFGQPSTAFGQQPQQSTSFGQQPQQTNSLFGAPSTSTTFGQPANSGSVSFFGQQQQQPQQQTSMFGQSAGTFGASTGGTLGLSQLTQSLRAPLQQSGTAAPPPLQPQTVTKAARYDDLSELDKNVVKEVDEHIRACMDVAKELKASTLGEEISTLGESIKKVQNDATIVKDNYNVAEVMARHVQMQLDSDLKDATAAVGIIDKFNANPKQPGHAPWQLEYPVKYFGRTEAQMRERLRSAKNTMQQIESLLRDSYRHEQRSAKEISNAVGNQTEGLLGLAGRTADLDAKVQQLKGDYTRLYRAKTGSTRDPFLDVPGRPSAPA
ncbi:hypothetical protein CALCODRAFT_482978 [Calocera cornea HHB12733]|uniref:Uncharacterized protein n=1 Tax=Calocera cornea HHB12733 TaxID=1353952 RepID=A0A165G688_9BASI|nr:hypothetical protein CALCODRAFT_482978 [Calocera cornea HHB12733]